jgi:hypothetical protein
VQQERRTGDAVGHVLAEPQLRRAVDVEGPEHRRGGRLRIEPMVHLDDEHRQPEDVGGEDELLPLVVADLAGAGQPPDGGHPLGLGEAHLPGEGMQVPHQGRHQLGHARVAGGGPPLGGEIGDVLLGHELHGFLLER